jgi:predicted Zn-dependent protease
MVSIAFLHMSAGCAMTPELDKNLGKSYEHAKSAQILNPEAQKNLDPVVGLDGETAQKSMKTYRGSFTPAAGEESYTVNLGSIGSIGQQSGEVPYAK